MIILNLGFTVGFMVEGYFGLRLIWQLTARFC